MADTAAVDLEVGMVAGMEADTEAASVEDTEDGPAADMVVGMEAVMEEEAAVDTEDGGNQLTRKHDTNQPKRRTAPFNNNGSTKYCRMNVPFYTMLTIQS